VGSSWTAKPCWEPSISTNRCSARNCVTAARDDSIGTKVSLVPWTMSVGAEISPSTKCGLSQKTSLSSARPCLKVGVKLMSPCSLNSRATASPR
jgi:hypothetical protein